MRILTQRWEEINWFSMAFLNQSQKEPEWSTGGKLLTMLTKRRRWQFRTQIVSTNNSEPHMMNLLLQPLVSSDVLYFLDAPGGCGKTFPIQTIMATMRSQSKIAIVIGSSGLAATLIPGGRTIHSTFKVPLNLTKCSSLFNQKRNITCKGYQERLCYDCG